MVTIYTVDHKNVPPNFFPYLHQISITFENSFIDTFCGQFAIKLSLKISPHPKCVATIPCKLHQPTRSSGMQIKREWTEENHGDELLLSQQDQPHIYRSIHQIAQAGVIRIIFSWRFWFGVFAESSAKELTEAHCYSRHSCSKLLLIDFIFNQFSDKCCSHQLHWKIWRIVPGAAENKTLAHKRFYAQEWHSTFLLPQLVPVIGKVHIPAILWLGAHETLVYNIRVSQDNAVTRLRCDGIFRDSFIASCSVIWMRTRWTQITYIYLSSDE